MTLSNERYVRAIEEVRTFLQGDSATRDAEAPTLLSALDVLYTEQDEQHRQAEAALKPTKATAAAALRDRFKQTKLREISPGWWVELRPLSLTGELLRASLPNEVLQAVLFDETLQEERDKEYHQRRYQGYRAIAARALVSPRLVIDREPNHDADEIGPDDLTAQELENVHWFAVKEVVPALTTAPFPDGQGPNTNQVGGIGRPGETVQPVTVEVPGARSADG